MKTRTTKLKKDASSPNRGTTARKALAKKAPTKTPSASALPGSSKAALRKALRLKVEALKNKPAKSEAICATILKHPAWKKATIVAIFAPLPIEPDVELLWEHAHGKVICYPLMHSEGLDLVIVSGPEELVVGRWGLREPVRKSSHVIPACEIDLLLVPGFGFCADGRRLGRGGGFYDRLLSSPGLKARQLAVAFHCQVIKDLPMESHDRRVDGVITERGVLPKPARKSKKLKI